MTGILPMGSPMDAAQATTAPPARSFYTRFGKRTLDLAIAVPALILVGPLMLVMALAMRFAMGGRVLFRQERVGCDERIFRLNKFRTMTDARDAQGRLLPDAQRLTLLGLLMRRLSIDELPQLINVLRGEMSLVGPRPLLVRYLPRYSPIQRQRHNVVPGITGWAQVNGRNSLSWDDRFALDIWYVENCSLMLDLRILLLTFTRGFGTSVVAAGGGRDVDEFWGSMIPPAGAPRSSPTDEVGDH
jgi:sugar transferase EpsL